MIEWLKTIDQNIVLFINGLNNPILDEVMWLISGKLIWFPLYIFLFFLVYKQLSIKQFILFFILGIGLVGLTDFIVTHGLKYPIGRYRPSHNLIIGELLHFYAISPTDIYKGGQYGFVSGHAANSSAIALFFYLALRKNHPRIGYFLACWVAIVCYSRIYLGVHYLTDILGGIVVGSVLTLLMRKVWLILKSKTS